MKLFYTAGTSVLTEYAAESEVAGAFRSFPNLTAGEAFDITDDVRISWYPVSEVVPGLTSPETKTVGVIHKATPCDQLDGNYSPWSAYLIVALTKRERDIFETVGSSHLLIQHAVGGITRSLYLVRSGFAYRGVDGRFRRWDGEKWEEGDVAHFARLQAVKRHNSWVKADDDQPTYAS